MDQKENKMVYHPNHYNKEGRKECWDEMIDIFGPEAVAIFDVLSAYKYHYRAGLKEGNPSEQDLEKIRNYMGHSFKITIAPPKNREHCLLANDCWNKMNDILEEE